MRKIFLIVTVCILITFTFSGCSLLQKLGLRSADDELRPVSSIILTESEADKLADKVPIHLYFANEDNSKLKLEVRYIPMTDARQSASHLASVIVRELIKGPSSGSGLKATIPSSTQLLAPVSIKSRIATVNLSSEFKTGHPGGKDAEMMTIYSIVNSLTELTDIQKVKFTIDGKSQKEYMGYFEFDAPFPRTASLISKEAAPESASISDSVPGQENNSDLSKKDQKDPGSKPSGDDSKTTGGSDGSDDGLEILE